MSAVAWALCSYLFLATALYLSNGHDQVFAGVLVVVSLAAAGSAFYGSPFPRGASPRRVSALAFSIALASSTAALLRAPGDFVCASLAPYYALSLLALGLVCSYAPEILRGAPAPCWLARIRPYCLLAVGFALGAWMLHASPSPRIDVWPIHQQGAQALLSGRSPYQPGVIATGDTFHQGKVIETYGYPPMNALLTTAAFALTGETRWAVLVAIVVNGYLLWRVARRGREAGSWPDLLLACSLLHPRGLFVLEQAWGDPLALPFLSGFALAAMSGRHRLAAVLCGLLCSTKQQFAIYGLILLRVSGIGVSGALLAFATAVATYLPFVVASPQRTWHALVHFHTQGAFRADSLSLTAMIAHWGLILPSWVGMVSTLAFLPLAYRAPRRTGALLLASSVAFLVFYVLGRQAFCNYYYVVCQTLLLAAAALAIEASASGSTLK